nr:MAG TPA: hypothetical protein [Caudoviricetes sp.]
MVSSKGYHGQSFFLLTLFSAIRYYFILIVEILLVSL